MKNKSSVLSVGIDISKRKLDVAFLLVDKSHSIFSVENSVKGIEKLMHSLKKQETAETVPCVIESTGDYHLLVALMIAQAGYSVNLINPIITRKYQRSSIRNAKNDSIDALRLAQIGVLEPSLPLFKMSKDEIATKKMVSLLSKLEKTRQQLQASIRRFKETEKTLGFAAIDLKEIDDALGSLDKVISALKRTIAEKTQRADEVSGIAGVSKESAAILITLVSGKEFQSRDQLVAYCGLDVAVRSSGQWRGKEKLSKRGDSCLRNILYKIAWGLKMHNPIFQEYYLKLRKQGRHYTECMIIVARKFLRFFFKIFFKGQAYPQSCG
jgi:transposase